ncbi:MAG: hypothetical protein EOP66_07500 [Sphingomonas sp.]|nr:MAG: hypothetical protein EOP66_07500 [Sphingomonas sp.]
MTLREAVERASLALAAEALRSCVDVDQPGPDGLSSLMAAAARGHSQMVELLLTAGANPVAVDRRAGTTALHKAAMSGNPDVTLLLLDAGAFIDQQIPVLGHTALMDAVIYKNLFTVRALLSRGARTSIRNHWNETALQLARRDGLDDIVDAITGRDTADIGLIERDRLVPAIMSGDLGALKRAIADGADVDQRRPMIGTPDDDYTPLGIAAREGRADIVRALLDAGADPRRPIGLFRGTALHEACYFGHADTIRVMLEARDPALGPAAELDMQGALNGLTPLHDAVWHGHVEASRTLVEAGHPVGLRTHAGQTAREMALGYGYEELADYLLTAERERTR